MPSQHCETVAGCGDDRSSPSRYHSPLLVNVRAGGGGEGCRRLPSGCGRGLIPALGPARPISQQVPPSLLPSFLGNAKSEPPEAAPAGSSM